MLTITISIIIAVLDQVTKWLVTWHLSVTDTVGVIPGFFQLRYIQNTGAAWGIFSGQNKWLVVLSLVMIVFLVLFRKSLYTEGLMSRVGLGLLGGGIAGNLVDRLKLGYVVDFLDFFIGKSHFPAFNVADSAICAGVGIYIFLQIRASCNERKAENSAGEVSADAASAESR